jgi:hypothetical protein
LKSPDGVFVGTARASLHFSLGVDHFGKLFLLRAFVSRVNRRMLMRM